MARTHADSRVTDPHGIPPVPADPPIPRPRPGRPVHDPWDPAYVPDGDQTHDDGRARDGDDRYADPRDAHQRYGEQAYPDAFYVDDPYTRHGGDGYARRTAAGDGGRRAQRRSRTRTDGEPHRRARPPRPPHADPPAREPDEPGLRLRTVLVPVVVGSLVAVGIGVWARTADPTGVAVNVAGFSSAGAVKTWLATLAIVFALVQLWTAMVMRGRSGSGARTVMVHRWSGRIAVLVTVPVAVQCLIAMGWSGATPRTLVHSVLGCVFYGAFVTKMLLLRRRGVPGWLLAVAGGLLLAVLAGIWLTSALWFFGTKGLTF